MKVELLNEPYVAPDVEALQVEVEHGFGASGVYPPYPSGDSSEETESQLPSWSTE